ncbi:MAG: hypothetical protein JKY44_06610 [Flavobacteriaceae bacterium]|nr:hypothetical protein [Flavobacteriaceae bacterium]
MLLAKLKEQLFKKKIQKRLNKTPDTRTPVSKEIHSVAIITTDKFSFELDIVKEIKSNFKSVRNVHIYAFRTFKKSDSISYNHFTEKDFDWSGKVKDPSLESFLENPFDLLIGYFNDRNVYLEFAALKSTATFKIGFAKVNDKLYDLVVNEQPNNIDSFMEVIKKYLELLHKI